MKQGCKFYYAIIQCLAAYLSATLKCWFALIDWGVDLILRGLIGNDPAPEHFSIHPTQPYFIKPIQEPWQLHRQGLQGKEILSQVELFFELLQETRGERQELDSQDCHCVIHFKS